MKDQTKGSFADMEKQNKYLSQSYLNHGTQKIQDDKSMKSMVTIQSDPEASNNAIRTGIYKDQINKFSNQSFKNVVQAEKPYSPKTQA